MAMSGLMIVLLMAAGFLLMTGVIIGLILLFMKRRTDKTCPGCGKSLKERYPICPYCGAHLTKEG